MTLPYCTCALAAGKHSTSCPRSLLTEAGNRGIEKKMRTIRCNRCGAEPLEANRAQMIGYPCGTCNGHFEEVVFDLTSSERVDHPAHYGGEDNPYEVIKVLKAWLTPAEMRGFCKGNAVKYLARANAKGATKEDHRKAAWYAKYLAEMGD